MTEKVFSRMFTGQAAHLVISLRMPWEYVRGAIHHTLRKELPNFDSLIAEGNLAPIKAWLTEKVYQHGKLLTPNEIIRSVTGEALNPAYLVRIWKRNIRKFTGSN